MSHDIEHDDEPAGIESLAREMTPPAALENRVVAALREEGLVAPPRRARGAAILRRAAMAAGLLVVTAAGFAGGRMTAPENGAGGADFMLLLRGGTESPAPLGEGAPDRLYAEYSKWYRAAERRGVMVGGEKLSDAPPVVLSGTGAGGGAGREMAGAVEGYFLIRASDEAEAERIAASCPHLRHGGTIEIRRIDRPGEGS